MYLFVRAFRDCLTTYFAGPYIMAGDFPLSRSFLRIRIILEEILQDEAFSKVASQYPEQFKALMPSDPDYPEADWEFGGEHQSLEFLLAAQELYVRTGEPPLLVTEADAQVLNAAYHAMKEYTRDGTRRFSALLERVKEKTEASAPPKPDAPGQTPPTAPIFNIANFHSVANSQVQVGSTHSTQTGTFTVTSHDLNALREFVQLLKEQLPAMQICPEDLAEARAEVATLEAQISSSRPKKVTIAESLKTIRNILEGATGSLLATGLLQLIPGLLSKFG